MKNYVKVKVKHTFTGDDGKQKRVSDEFVFDAMSCPEGMLRAVRHFNAALKDWSILSLGQSNISETVVTGLTGRFYRVNVKYTTESDSGKDVTTSSIVLVEAKSTREAEQMIDELNADTVIDYEIIGNNISKVSEVVFTETDVRKFPLDNTFMRLLSISNIHCTSDANGVFVDLAPLTASEKEIISNYQCTIRMANPMSEILNMPGEDD